MPPTDSRDIESSASTAQWVTLSPSTATPELIEAMSTFRALDYPAGKAATQFLADEAVVNSSMTRTHLLVRDNRVEGFISLCSGSVRLSERSIRSLGLRTTITTMPAIVLTLGGSSPRQLDDWTRTDRDRIRTRQGIGREHRCRCFRARPVGREGCRHLAKRAVPFQGFRAEAKKKPPRLWTPLDPI